MEKTIVGRKQTLKEDRHYAAKMIECSKETSAPHKRDITEHAI
jgi:ribosomal protein L30E